MRRVALLAVLACLATPPCSANILRAVSAERQQALELDRVQHGELQRRPANASSPNGNAGAAPAAPGAGRGARLGEDQSYVLWLRYTQPRLMSSFAEHDDETVTEGVVTQPLSHADPDNSATWPQTYFRCSDGHETGGPAFVMLSGTADYLPDGGDWLREGFMATLARKYKADRFFLPTRFFGAKSHPTPDASVDGLKYLNVEEVLLDVASFLDQLKEAGVLRSDQKVVLFGAGFGGTVAAWARMQYPDIVHGVVASSANLEPRYNVPSYFPVVSEAMDWYHKKQFDFGCADRFRSAFVSLEHALSLPAGRAEFNRAFAPCTNLPEDADGVLSDEDRAHILGLVVGVFADAVQEDQDGPRDANYRRPGGDKLWPYCETFAESSDTPLRTLGNLVRFTYQGLCLETSFSKLVKTLSASGWSDKANAGGLRPWLWLQCTELGQLPVTSDPDKFPFSTRIDAQFYRKLCASVFYEGVTDSLVDNIAKLLSFYHGLEPDISNAIFVKGALDPWKSLSPDKEKDGMHVFSVLRASHAHDLFPKNIYDPPWMKKTRKDVERILASWLS